MIYQIPIKDDAVEDGEREFTESLGRLSSVMPKDIQAPDVSLLFSRTELVEHLYDQDFDRDSNTIEVFVGRVRKKIGPDRIETVRGLGYRLIALEGEATDA